MSSACHLYCTCQLYSLFNLVGNGNAFYSFSSPRNLPDNEDKHKIQKRASRVHPGELWVSKQRVHIALEASKSAGAKGDVQKICGFVKRIPWSEHVLIYLLPILFQHCACNAWRPMIVQERVDFMLFFLSLIWIWNFIWILAYKCIYLLKTDIYSQYFVDFKSVSWWFRLQRFCWTIFSLLRKVTSKVGNKRVA